MIQSESCSQSLSNRT